MSREIERYNLLEQKFRDMLVKYNLAQKELEKNEKLVFTMGTGAALPRYSNYLDEGGDFTSGKKKRNAGAFGAAASGEKNDLDFLDQYSNNELDESLNKLNRRY